MQAAASQPRSADRREFTSAAGARRAGRSTRCATARNRVRSVSDWISHGDGRAAHRRARSLAGGHRSATVVSSQSVRWRRVTSRAIPRPGLDWLSTVGIPIDCGALFEDVRQRPLHRRVRPEIFVLPAYMNARRPVRPGRRGARVRTKEPSASSRSRCGPAAICRALVRTSVRRWPPSIPTSVSTRSRRGRSRSNSSRASASTRSSSVSFASVAALLAAIGIYGVLAYAVVHAHRRSACAWHSASERHQFMALILRRGIALHGEIVWGDAWGESAPRRARACCSRCCSGSNLATPELSSRMAGPHRRGADRVVISRTPRNEDRSDRRIAGK